MKPKLHPLGHPKAHQTGNISKQTGSKTTQKRLRKISRKFPKIIQVGSRHIVFFSLWIGFLSRLCFQVGLGVEKVQKKIPPKLQFNPKGNNIILGQTIAPTHTCQFSRKNGTHFGLKLHLVGFAMAGPTHCKMKASGAASEERFS